MCSSLVLVYLVFKGGREIDVCLPDQGLHLLTLLHLALLCHKLCFCLVAHKASHNILNSQSPSNLLDETLLIERFSEFCLAEEELHTHVVLVIYGACRCDALFVLVHLRVHVFGQKLCL